MPSSRSVPASVTASQASRAQHLRSPTALDGGSKAQNQAVDDKDGSFELCELHVDLHCNASEVGSVESMCGVTPGDSLTVKNNLLYLPPGQGVSIYMLSALLPYLSAMQRPNLHPNDGVSSGVEIACPNPSCTARMRITRRERKPFGREGSTATTKSSGSIAGATAQDNGRIDATLTAPPPAPLIQDGKTTLGTSSTLDLYQPQSQASNSTAPPLPTTPKLPSSLAIQHSPPTTSGSPTPKRAKISASQPRRHRQSSPSRAGTNTGSGPIPAGSSTGTTRGPGSSLSWTLRPLTHKNLQAKSGSGTVQPADTSAAQPRGGSREPFVSSSASGATSTGTTVVKVSTRNAIKKVANKDGKGKSRAPANGNQSQSTSTAPPPATSTTRPTRGRKADTVKVKAEPASPATISRPQPIVIAAGRDNAGAGSGGGTLSTIKVEESAGGDVASFTSTLPPGRTAPAKAQPFNFTFPAGGSVVSASAAVDSAHEGGAPSEVKSSVIPPANYTSTYSAIPSTSTAGARHRPAPKLSIPSESSHPVSSASASASTRPPSTKSSSTFSRDVILDTASAYPLTSSASSRAPSRVGHSDGTQAEIRPPEEEGRTRDANVSGAESTPTLAEQIQAAMHRVRSATAPRPWHYHSQVQYPPHPYSHFDARSYPQSQPQSPPSRTSPLPTNVSAHRRSNTADSLVVGAAALSLGSGIGRSLANANAHGSSTDGSRSRGAVASVDSRPPTRRGTREHAPTSSASASASRAPSPSMSASPSASPYRNIDSNSNVDSDIDYNQRGRSWEGPFPISYTRTGSTASSEPDSGFSSPQNLSRAQSESGLGRSDDHRFHYRAGSYGGHAGAGYRSDRV
ncbi:hypothetical protein CVT26_010414 [Gymnopilus dilepis]|uniref:Uncharacterized protein n=1 Tax=Gymnopilus dilepis TaxID=231916 RepID=A0A409W4P2_9AGAR|nr:hypothetical protein CVT26_010414 [Gymnopilus dilepis]